MKRITSGVYEYTHNDGTVFIVSKYTSECETLVGKWLWRSDNGKEYSEPCDTKRECVSWLMDYLAHRVYNKTWGWVYE